MGAVTYNMFVEDLMGIQNRTLNEERPIILDHANRLVTEEPRGPFGSCLNAIWNCFVYALEYLYSFCSDQPFFLPLSTKISQVLTNAEAFLREANPGELSIFLSNYTRCINVIKGYAERHDLMDYDLDLPKLRQMVFVPLDNPQFQAKIRLKNELGSNSYVDYKIGILRSNETFVSAEVGKGAKKELNRLTPLERITYRVQAVATYRLDPPKKNGSYQLTINVDGIPREFVKKGEVKTPGKVEDRSIEISNQSPFTFLISNHAGAALDAEIHFAREGGNPGNLAQALPPGQTVVRPLVGSGTPLNLVHSLQVDPAEHRLLHMGYKHGKYTLIASPGRLDISEEPTKRLVAQ